MELRYGGSNVGIVLLLHRFHAVYFPPLSGGLNLNSSNNHCARKRSSPPLSGWLKKKWPSWSYFLSHDQNNSM